MRETRTPGPLPLFLIGVVSASFGAHAIDVGPPEPGVETVYVGDGLAIGPIAGFTTGWHPAPLRTSIPERTALELRLDYRTLDDEELSRRTAGIEPVVEAIEWTGVSATREADGRALADARLDRAGATEISVRVETFYPGADLRVVHSDTLYLDVVGLLAPRSMAVDSVDASSEYFVAPDVVGMEPEAARLAINDATMDYFFGGTVAALGRTPDGTFVTSVDNPLQLSATLVPEGFGPLVEWRFDGETYFGALGATLEHRFETSGSHTVSVGPPERAVTARFDVYSVEITSHVSGQDRIVDGETVTFTARTDPPGLESRIRWLASTKYGATDVIVGAGAEFPVRFDDTWGPQSQWLGVRADHAVFNQDSKVLDSLECEGGECGAGPIYCLYGVQNVQGAECGSIVGTGTLCLLCDGNFPGGDCPSFAGKMWRHRNAQGNTTCSGDVVNDGGLSCDVCPATDSKTAVFVAGD